MTITLGADFPAATAEQWRRLALAALRKSGGATDETGLEEVDDLLATVTYDGVRLPALNTPDGLTAGFPGLFPYVRGARAARGLIGGWDIRPRLDGSGSALDELENGATSLWLAVPPESFEGALTGVHLDLASVVLDPGDRFAEAADALFALAAARPPGPAAATAGPAAGSADSAAGSATGPAAGSATGPGRAAVAHRAGLHGGFGADPLGWRARTGERGALSGALADAASLAARCVADAPGMRAITVDATIYHEAGGSDAEELGCALAAGVAYLRALTDAGLPVRAALAQLEFRYAATADQFATIAKLRAARRVWARVAEMCEAADAGGQRQHAVTSAAMMTARDPWVNLLRTTLAAFAAGVGGADAVTVLPFDHALGVSDASARRLARNTQILLIEEAHAARVLDPAGGSWYVERYTEELAQAAWDWFTTTEQAGGFAAALDSGLVADRLAATWQRRSDDIAHRRAPITGVSEFPNLTEKLPARPPTPDPAGATGGGATTGGTAGGGTTTGGLPRHRYAEPFERLRDRSDAHLAATGERPTVSLITLGSAAASGARVTFATNLFAAGGIAVNSDPGSAVVCVCGPDKAYIEGAAPAAEAARAAGARKVLLAGRGDYGGVDGYVFTGCDAVAVLTATLADLGVADFGVADLGVQA